MEADIQKFERKTFFAFDTETKNGKAFLISHSNQNITGSFEVKTKQDVIQFFQDCVNKKYGQVGWLYNIDYDVLALLKFFPEDDIKMIYIQEITIEGFSILYFPKKFFQIRQGKKVVEFYDLYQFFHTSLDKASQNFIGEKKMKENISDMKNIYQEYLKNRKKVKAYAEQDAKITYRLSEYFRTMLENFGIETNKYYSTGYLALKYLGIKKVSYEKISGGDIAEFVAQSYFGGRVEMRGRGFFKETYLYDINSAYPYHIANLKRISLKSFDTNIDPSADYYFADVEVTYHNDIVSPFPVRRNNILIYPQGRIRGVFDSITLKSAMKFGAKINKVHRCLNVYCDRQKPFYDLVNVLYNKRIKTKKEDEKFVIKLILNSLYGKFAQRKRRFIEVDENGNDLLDVLYCIDNDLKNGTSHSNRSLVEIAGRFFIREKTFAKNSNIIYASLITAGTRMQMYEAIMNQSSDYIGSMTDGLILKRPLRDTSLISTKKDLGMFSLKESGWCYIVGSGIYQTEKEGTRFRGFKTKHDLISLAQQNGHDDIILLPSTEKKGLGKLVVQGMQYDDLNEIFENEKEMKLNFDVKRRWSRSFRSFDESLNTFLISKTISL
jgi:hypothetical protein